MQAMLRAFMQMMAQSQQGRLQQQRERQTGRHLGLSGADVDPSGSSLTPQATWDSMFSNPAPVMMQYSPQPMMPQAPVPTASTPVLPALPLDPYGIPTIDPRLQLQRNLQLARNPRHWASM